jgi:uncharacterized protein (DUF1499 family)
MLGWIILALVVAGLAFIRLSPSDVSRFHRPVTATADETKPGGAVRVIAGDQQTMTRIDAAARALPRTKVFAGSVENGLITYETRSALFGFPDYTTVQLVDDQVRMYARLRFGRSDLGVNAARLGQLLSVIQ